jgi:hypothetical protein
MLKSAAHLTWKMFSEILTHLAFAGFLVMGRSWINGFVSGDVNVEVPFIIR